MNKETKQAALLEIAQKIYLDFPYPEARLLMSSDEWVSWFEEAVKAGAEWQSTQQPQESAGVPVKAIDLLTNASPYIEEKLNKHTIDLICKQIDGYIATILPPPPVNTK